MKNFSAIRFARASHLLGAIAASMMLFTTVNAQTIVIDDFQGGLTATSTVILDVNGGASNQSTWQINGSGQLELATNGFDDIEQLAYIYNGFSLGVGDELQADFTSTIAGNRNFGLYVGGTSPTAGVRQDYISVYGGSNPNNNIFTRGFDGTTEYNNLPGTPATGLIDSMFIARTATNTFDVGFVDSAGTRTVIATRTPTTANSADVLGFYADVRADGALSAADNLRIVSAIPEPSSLACLALGSIGLFTRRRRS